MTPPRRPRIPQSAEAVPPHDKRSAEPVVSPLRTGTGHSSVGGPKRGDERLAGGIVGGEQGDGGLQIVLEPVSP